MNILFVHNNFPAQFRHVARSLAAGGHKVAAIGGPSAQPIAGTDLHTYRHGRGSAKDIHPFAIRFERDCLLGEAAAGLAERLAANGYRPDVVVGHVGWGELLFLKDIWPQARVIAYAEFYYHGQGADVGFDPEFGDSDLANRMRVRAKNAGIALAVAEADGAVTPTEWQRSSYPQSLRPQIVVIHDGIDTGDASPKSDERLRIPNGPSLRTGEEVVTYVNRYLEPMRGIHVFLRALPDILAARPHAHAVIMGSDQGKGYGGRAAGGRSWKELMLDELGARLDTSRVHWLGRVDRSIFLKALAVSRVHVYLTYPFVLSWSMLEAMSAGCLLVASDTPPVREVVENGRNGLLVDFFDPKTLAHKVIDCLAQPHEAFSALRAAARQTVIERYDRRACVARLVTYIEDVAQR